MANFIHQRRRRAGDGISAVIDDICAGAHVRNGELDMTGILTVKDGRFAQVSEGQERALRRLMASIERDPRHHSVTVFTDGPIEMRRSRDWRMVYRAPKEFVRDQLDTVVAQMALMGQMVSHRID